jgi:hypothetical protein
MKKELEGYEMKKDLKRFWRREKRKIYHSKWKNTKRTYKRSMRFE